MKRYTTLAEWLADNRREAILDALGALALALIGYIVAVAALAM